MPKVPLRIRVAQAIAGNTKSFIPSLLSTDDWGGLAGGRLNDYSTPDAQLKANVGWCFTANTAIVDPCAAVELKLMRRMKDADAEEVKPGEPGYELIELLDAPNLIHTGEQMRQLHFTYMNFVGRATCT